MSWLILQRALAEASGLPGRKDFERWAKAAFTIGGHPKTKLVVRIVDEQESADLNQRFRHKAGPTNVLSFPFEPPPGVREAHLGDLVICAQVVRREAAEQGKPEADHWAHMLVHGVLHLLGYDHQDEAEAERMESLERRILASANIPDPYRDGSEAPS